MTIGENVAKGIGESVCSSGLHEINIPNRKKLTNFFTHSIIIKALAAFHPKVTGIDFLLLNPTRAEFRIVMKCMEH